MNLSKSMVYKSDNGCNKPLEKYYKERDTLLRSYCNVIRVSLNIFYENSKICAEFF